MYIGILTIIFKENITLIKVSEHCNKNSFLAHQNSEIYKISTNDLSRFKL